MSEAEEAAGEDASVSETGTSVTRGARFVQLIADQIGVIPLNRDFNLVLLNNDDRFVRRIPVESSAHQERVQDLLEPRLTEVARIRMNADVAVQTAMVLLVRLIENKRVRHHDLMRSIASILAANPESQDEVETGEG